jgi:hypothetical protein
MRVDIFTPPPPLPFSDGENTIKIMLRKPTGVDRLAFVDAVRDESAINQKIQVAVDRLVVGWEGIEDMDGNPLPLEREDAEGKKTRNFDAAMGAMPAMLQDRILMGVAAFVGVIDGASIRPTSTPAGNTDTTASGAPSS